MGMFVAWIFKHFSAFTMCVYIDSLISYCDIIHNFAILKFLILCMGRYSKRDMQKNEHIFQPVFT